MIYELESRYDTRKSFYGKAKIKQKQYDNFIATILYSYDMEVASIEKYNNGMIVYFCNGQYSQTTTKHQKEFFKQNGLDDEQIKELFKKGILEV